MEFVHRSVLLLPTVVLNGSLWGQCDALYGAFALHALADALEGRPKASAALLGIAFSFKLQTVFILPLWAVLWMAGRTRFRDLLCFPLAYAVTCIPALLLGKPLGPAGLAAVGEQKKLDSMLLQGLLPGPYFFRHLSHLIGDQGVVQVGQHQPDSLPGQGLWVYVGHRGVNPPGYG